MALDPFDPIAHRHIVMAAVADKPLLPYSTSAVYLQSQGIEFPNNHDDPDDKELFDELRRIVEASKAQLAELGFDPDKPKRKRTKHVSPKSLT